LIADAFHAVGQFFAEDFPSFDNLVFKRKTNSSADILSGLDSLVFHFGGEKNKCSADNFSGLDAFAFHLDSDF
jgi:hypothetical protein